MKKLFFTVTFFSLALLAFSQNSNVAKFETQAPSAFSVEKNFRNGTTPDFTKQHVYKRQVMMDNHGIRTGSGSRAITFDTLGSSGNAFTLLNGAVNRIASNLSTNTIVFIHRANSDVDQNSNVARYKYDISKNGGSSWTIDIGDLTPTLENFDTAGRFPQAVLFNPVGNTNPDNSHLVYYGTWLPFGGTGNGRTWDGIVTGVARTNNDPSTFTETISRPNNGDIAVATGLTNGLPGEFWAINFATQPGDSLNSIGLVLSKGVWNSNTNDVDWSHNILNPPFVQDASGRTAAAATVNIAFSPDGMDGWIAMLSDIVSDEDSTLQPVFYRTQDGGATWTGPEQVNLSQFQNVKDGLTVDTIPTSAFDADLVVDANGSPHFAFVVGSSGGTGYSIATAGAGGAGSDLKLYDISFNENVSVECQWQAFFIDDVQTLRGTLSSGGGADFTEDNRPQLSRSEDGTIVFIGWADSDPTLTGGNNDLPDFKGRMINVTNGLSTPVENFTQSDFIFSGSALLPSVSPTFIVNGTTFSVPTVFLQFNQVSGLADDPTQFFYIKGIEFEASEFTIPLGANVPDLILLGDNPQRVFLGDSYIEAGATAEDCTDGDLTSNINIDASNVNTNARNIYTVNYQVTNSLNATAFLSRQVIVNTEPDARFGFITNGLSVQFRDSSLFDPTGWVWNFGNGNGNSQRNPVTTYATAGTFTVCLRATNAFNDPPFNRPVDEECKTVTVEPVGIENKIVKNAFNVFPNPNNSGVFTIELLSQDFKNAQLEVFTVLGEKLLENTLNINSQSRFRLDMSGQANGVYFIKFTTEIGSATKSVTIIQ